MVNKSLKLLFLFNGIFVLGSSLLGPLYAIYVEQLDQGILSVSISWTVLILATTLVTWVLSLVGDTIKHKRYLIAAGYLIRVFCWTGFIFITNIPHLLVIQFFLGAGDALGGPAFDTLFAEHLDKGKHLQDYSDWKIVSNIITMVGTMIGGYIIYKYGFDLVFVTMALLGTLSFIGIIYSPKVEKKR